MKHERDQVTKIIISVCHVVINTSLVCFRSDRQPHSRPESFYEDDDDEEILGSDDDEQEDPKDYCKGIYIFTVWEP